MKKFCFNILKTILWVFLCKWNGKFKLSSMMTQTVHSSLNGQQTRPRGSDVVTSSHEISLSTTEKFSVSAWYLIFFAIKMPMLDFFLINQKLYKWFVICTRLHCTMKNLTFNQTYWRKTDHDSHYIFLAIITIKILLSKYEETSSNYPGILPTPSNKEIVFAR